MVLCQSVMSVHLRISPPEPDWTWNECQWTSHDGRADPLTDPRRTAPDHRLPRRTTSKEPSLAVLTVTRAALTGRALGRRLPQLAAGLCLYGFSAALMYRSTLGQNPWGVFHQGLAAHLGLTVGTVTTAVGALVLLLWAPLRQRPGLGTVANVLIIGPAMDLSLAALPVPHPLPVRGTLLVLGIVLNALATALYIGARLGPGPRDGLMTGLHRRTGRSLRLLRTGIEAAVLLAGVLLGGNAGVGTVAYALAIGPLTQFFLPRCTVGE
jgi:uncharacterized membrane protein YczE